MIDSHGKKFEPGILWTADDPAREAAIIRVLCEGDKGFMEIFNGLKLGKRGWGRQTLNLYLKELTLKGCIRRVRRGKREIYSLDVNNPYVRKVIGRVRIRGRVELNRLNEGEYVSDWLNSIEFAFLNVMQDYVYIGRGQKQLKSLGDGRTVTVEDVLRSHLSDMVEVARIYGQLLAERIARGELDLEELWRIRDGRLRQILEQRRRSTGIARRRSGS